MNSLPKSLSRTIDFFEKLPGIGPKTAKRLAFYLLRLPQPDLDEAAKNISELKHKSLYCRICMNLTEEKECSICSDDKRDQTTIIVVETVLDLLAMEVGNQFTGIYHVLHGRIDPLNYIGPDDIYISKLLDRIKDKTNIIKEIILATNPNMEGEATAIYIKKRILEISPDKLKITRLAYGLPIGAELEYADYMTLLKALEGRRDY
ncbi:recombination protein RecR [Candidatus Roizmanbacteria bacterium RIFCSPLOWO2_02_FULL_38_10]|uniref:Recombination protein RecR n=1 Tax=Candidatus Roizmanbacteria bacterium RIFCSPLOWO2_02_FULL_38_10 TaxID=1802074 RepID=A0A1F7JLI7_9BACT|nr:MAG: recombination protein RecR [Candidatus Roizmanbacteria bacterium RIFCSPLOWO2_02_FULL_38_10]